MPDRELREQAAGTEEAAANVERQDRVQPAVLADIGRDVVK